MSLIVTAMNNNYFFLTNQLSTVETGIITSIISHIERGDKKVSISQIAAENYVSNAFIVKMSKRLGFSGYTDLFYNLSHTRQDSIAPRPCDLGVLLDNYSEALVGQFLGYLRQYRDRKFFVVGAGFADISADYIAQRLSVCGFMVFSRVSFYDYMLFRDGSGTAMQTNIEPAVLIAISQSGETDLVLNSVYRAKENGFKVVSFTKIKTSTLAGLSDVIFLVESDRQALISAVPNPFFGKVILIMEELLGLYFQGNE